MSSESDNQYGTESDESQESGEEYGGTANATKERQNGHVPLALETARKLLARGVMPTWAPLGEKHIKRTSWQDERYDRDAIETVFNRHDINVSTRNGHLIAADGRVLSDKFLDVDLDILEAVRVAPFYLPKTGMMWGRAHKPRSHYGYHLTSSDKARTREDFVDPLLPKRGKDGQKATVVELRYSGHSLAPGSLNTMSDGMQERVRWEEDGDGEPSVVAFETVESAVEHIAAAALVAKYWTEGIRHQAALPLAGLLYHGGLSEGEAERFVRAVCAGAREDAEATSNRVDCVRSTYARGRAGETVTGGPTLEDYLDERVIKLLRRWLHLKRHAAGALLGPDGYVLADDGDGERFAAKWEGKALYCAAEDPFSVILGSRPGKFSLCGPRTLQASIQRAT